MARSGREPPADDGLVDLLDLSSGEPRPPHELTQPRQIATREHALIRRLAVVVVAGPGAGVHHLAPRARIVIGTHLSADVRLGDRAVSRLHCELALEGDRAVVRDLGSKNGTRVDGVAVLAAPVHHGAVLGVGDTKLRIELGDADVPVPLSDHVAFGAAVGRSPAMRALFAVLESAAPSDATVLLEGETGVGKDVLAQALHEASARAEAPLMVVDCAALPPGLLESELFGHERGAFTGADRARPGAFEAAHGGTLFLDEVGELDLELQPKLLGVLERREVRRVGGAHTRPANVRIVAATSRRLSGEVNAGRFRADLYYRLAVVPVVVPPLRERDGDLPLLCERLLADLTGSEAAGRAAAARLLTPAFVAALGRHSWPGNVRELRNYLERCLVIAEAGPPGAEAAGGGDGDGETRAAGASVGPTPPVIDPDRPLKEARDRHVAWFERRYLEALLARHGHNVSAAARAAGMGRAQLYRLLWRAGLR
jgi:transcriptional regulator with GAF, ATPase, and Fis domain